MRGAARQSMLGRDLSCVCSEDRLPIALRNSAILEIAPGARGLITEDLSSLSNPTACGGFSTVGHGLSSATCGRTRDAKRPKETRVSAPTQFPQSIATLAAPSHPASAVDEVYCVRVERAADSGHSGHSTF
jgi:hypothetical protein